jgi:hypothetical protein
MIGTPELLYDIDLKLNKIATNSHQNINMEDKILALNEAQLMLIKKKVALSPSGNGLDSSKSRYDDLQVLIVPHVTLPSVATSEPGLSSYKSGLNGLLHRYMYFVDVFFLCSKGNCRQHRVTGFRIKHADLQPILKNANTAPSFEYQETPVTVTADSLYGYTDGTFTIDSCHLSYVRYPRKIDVEGYIDFDGTPSVNADCELPQHLKDELVDIAIQQLAMSTENTPAAQFAQLRIQQQP